MHDWKAATDASFDKTCDDLAHRLANKPRHALTSAFRPSKLRVAAQPSNATPITSAASSPLSLFLLRLLRGRRHNCVNRAQNLDRNFEKMMRQCINGNVFYVGGRDRLSGSELWLSSKPEHRRQQDCFFADFACAVARLHSKSGESFYHLWVRALDRRARAPDAGVVQTWSGLDVAGGCVPSVALQMAASSMSAAQRASTLPACAYNVEES